MQKQNNPFAQQATWSTYKNRNTLKVLVGANPGGVISYVSEAYGGSSTDRKIVERFCLPEMLTSGDQVMADKGFNCNDMFIPTKWVSTFLNFLRRKAECRDNNER